MDFSKKIPIGTSGLNAQLLNHAAAKRKPVFSFSPPSGHVPQIDGIDHAPAMAVLPSPMFQIQQQPETKPTTKTGFFTDLFSARKVNNE